MHDHDRGLQFDVSTLMTRRRALQLVAAGGLAAVVGCGSSSSDSSGTAAATTEAAGTTTDAAPGATAEIPEETAGPFPADGSNGVNVLTRERHRALRPDIELRVGVGDGRGRAPHRLAHHPRHRGRRHAGRRRRRLPVALRPGGPLLALRLGDRGRELPARRPGRRTPTGRSSFTTIWPGAYSGRWPHIHFEVYPSLAEATSAGVEARDLADRPARGRLPARLRHRRLRAERAEPRPAPRWRPTWSSPTATPPSSPRPAAPRRRG